MYEVIVCRYHGDSTNIFRILYLWTTSSRMLRVAFSVTSSCLYVQSIASCRGRVALAKQFCVRLASFRSWYFGTIKNELFKYLARSRSYTRPTHRDLPPALQKSSLQIACLQRKLPIIVFGCPHENFLSKTLTRQYIMPLPKEYTQVSTQ
jgi:hypothetical protein